VGATSAPASWCPKGVGVGTQRFYPNAITNKVGLLGDANQLQDDPDNPDNDWIVADPNNDSGSFTLEYDPATFPAESLVAGGDFRFALFVRNSKTTGEAQWGGTLRLNGGAHEYTRVGIPEGTGVKQEEIAQVTGGVPLTSLTIDIDWTRSGGSANNRSGADFDAIELILTFADTFDFPLSDGNGVGLGTGTMDIAPSELGTADGEGVGSATGTIDLLPPREMDGSGGGVGAGIATVSLLPPVELASVAQGVGSGISTMNQLPYDMAASGSGIGHGVGSITPFASQPVLNLTIIDPAENDTIHGLYEVIAREEDATIPFVRVGINPAHEKDPLGYKADEIVPAGDWMYAWSTSPYAGQSVDIEATAIFQGAPSGMGITGFQVGGGWGVEELAINAPLSVDVVSGAFVELQASGTGLGDGSATASLIPVTELGAASGAGSGEGIAGSIDFDLGTLAGSGVGAGTATLNVLYGASAGGQGRGTGIATFDVLLDMVADGGGVGTGVSEFLVTIDMNAVGTGQGKGNAPDMDVLHGMTASGTGVGGSFGLMSMVEGIIWQDPANGINDDPWNPAAWKPFIQTPQSINATATIQDNTDELTNDPNPPAMNFGGLAGDRIVAPHRNVLTLQDYRGDDATNYVIFNAATNLLANQTDLTPKYGTGHFSAEATTTTTANVGLAGGQVPALPGDRLAVSGWQAHNSIGPNVIMRIGVVWETGAGGFLGGNFGPWKRLDQNAWHFASMVSALAPALTEQASIRVQMSGHSIGDLMYWDTITGVKGETVPLQQPAPPLVGATIVNTHGTLPFADLGVEHGFGQGVAALAAEGAFTAELHDGPNVLAELLMSSAIDGDHTDKYGTAWSLEGDVTQVDNGGAYHIAEHTPTDSVRLDVLVETITDPVLSSRQAVYLQASGAVDINGVPEWGISALIEDPTGGNLQVQAYKHIGGVNTKIGAPLDVSTIPQPFNLTLAKSGVSAGLGVDVGGPNEVSFTGSDIELALIPEGVTWVNTYNFGTADFRYDNWKLVLLPYTEFSGDSHGVGTGEATMSTLFIDMSSISHGVGTGEATMSSAGYLLVASGTGVGTGTGVFEEVTVDMEALGLGVGSGFATMVLGALEMSGAGHGVGTGRAGWNTGIWEGGGVCLPGDGAADAIVPGGAADAEGQGGSSEAETDDGAAEADILDGVATVGIEDC